MHVAYEVIRPREWWGRRLTLLMAGNSATSPIGAVLSIQMKFNQIIVSSDAAVSQLIATRLEARGAGWCERLRCALEL